MYVYIHVWLGVCVIYNPQDFDRVCIHEYIYVRMYACIYMYIYVYICMHVCVHVCIYAFMYACMYICTYVSILLIHLGKIWNRRQCTEMPTHRNAHTEGDNKRHAHAPVTENVCMYVCIYVCM
jgi:hypothetical protein